MTWRNWSGAVTADPDRIERPATEAELQTVVREASDRDGHLRVAGSGHSFSPVVPSEDTLVSLERYTGVVEIDREAEQATVRAGTQLSELNRTLREHGLAISNLGDIDLQTVAGAFATGTHGTGLDFGVLANQASRLRICRSDGAFVDVEAGDDAFPAAQVSLGTLGVIAEATIDVEPAYDLCLRRWRVPLEELLENIDRFHGSHRNWEFFWFPHTDHAQVKTFDEVPPGVGAEQGPLSELLDAIGTRIENGFWESVCRLGTRYPRTAAAGARLTSATLTEKVEVGPSHEIFANPRNVRFNETEHSVPAEELPTVVREVRDRIDREDIPVQFPMECRFVGADEPYLSPAYGRDSGFIAVHTYHEKSLPEYFETCEEVFDAHDGRPHWGKQHSKTVEQFRELYPKWDEFQEIRREFDPDGLFMNDHLRGVFGDPETARVAADD